MKEGSWEPRQRKKERKAPKISHGRERERRAEAEGFFRAPLLLQTSRRQKKGAGKRAAVVLLYFFHSLLGITRKDDERMEKEERRKEWKKKEGKEQRKQASKQASKREFRPTTNKQRKTPKISHRRTRKSKSKRKKGQGQGWEVQVRCEGSSELASLTSLLFVASGIFLGRIYLSRVQEAGARKSRFEIERHDDKIE